LRGKGVFEFTCQGLRRYLNGLYPSEKRFSPTVGFEQAGGRQAVVIQNNVGNRNGPTVIVVFEKEPLTVLTYLFCVLGKPKVSSFAKGLSFARKEVKRNLFAWIYQQSQAGVPLSHILVRLKVA